MSKKLKIPLDKSLYYAIIGKSLRDIRVWRSLVARLTGGQEAAGSSPVTRTSRKRLFERIVSFIFFNCAFQLTGIILNIHYIKKKKLTPFGISFIGGESGIRTLGEFPHTAFRVLHLRPLGQLSKT